MFDVFRKIQEMEKRRAAAAALFFFFLFFFFKTCRFGGLAPLALRILTSGTIGRAGPRGDRENEKYRKWKKTACACSSGSFFSISNTFRFWGWDLPGEFRTSTIKAVPWGVQRRAQQCHQQRPLLMTLLRWGHLRLSE